MTTRKGEGKGEGGWEGGRGRGEGRGGGGGGERGAIVCQPNSINTKSEQGQFLWLLPPSLPPTLPVGSLKEEVHRFDVEFLGHHHSPHDGIDEEGE